MRGESKIQLLCAAMSIALFFSAGHASGKKSDFVFGMNRVQSHGSLVAIEVNNRTPDTWCINPLSFSPSQFEIKIGNRVVQSRSISPYLTVACRIVKPGEVLMKRVNLKDGFSEDEIKNGVLCYNYAYWRDPLPQRDEKREAAALGKMCEAGQKKTYSSPTD
jgi:hypothetical protein